MGSWTYVSFFPGPAQALRQQDAVDALVKIGMAFERSGRALVICQDAGESGLVPREKIKFAEPVDEDLKRRLRDGEQFIVDCKMGPFGIACEFQNHWNPNIQFGWANFFYKAMGEGERLEFHARMMGIADAVGAWYVLVGELDCQERFFVEVDEERLLDIGSMHCVCDVWVRSRLGARVPRGVNPVASREIEYGFTCHRPLLVW